METNEFGYVEVAYANNNSEQWMWDDFCIFYHPEKKRWFWDSQGGCSCNYYEFVEAGLVEFPITDLNKVIRENVEFPHYKDSVRREVKEYIKEHNL